MEAAWRKKDHRGLLFVWSKKDGYSAEVSSIFTPISPNSKGAHYDQQRLRSDGSNIEQSRTDDYIKICHENNLFLP